MPVIPGPVVPPSFAPAHEPGETARVQHLSGIGERPGLRVPRANHDVHESTYFSQTCNLEGMAPLVLHKLHPGVKLRAALAR